jgi:hypothetical protein
MITSPDDGDFVGRDKITVSGSRAPDQAIQLLSPNGGEPLCVREPNGTTTWSCPATVESSPSVTLRVVDGSDSSLSHSISIRVLTPPVVTGGALAEAVSNGMVRGTAYPGASVAAGLSNGLSCTTTADTSGAWACLFDGLRTSGTFTVVALQMTAFSTPMASADSAPVKLLFDIDRPAPPTLASPTANSRVPAEGTTYAGTGEPGATVTVFADAYSLCETRVDASGGWTCFAGGIEPGTYSVRTIQQDDAGNVGPASDAVIIGYGPAPVVPPPAVSGGPDPVPAPAVPVPAATPTPAPDPHQSASPDAPATQTAPQGAPPRTPEQARPGGPVPGGWNDPTRFAVAVAPPGSVPAFEWWQAILLAFAVVALVAIPARLLAGTISRARDGHPLWGGRKVSGRNHLRVEYETAPEMRLNRRLMAGAALIAAAALVMLSGPIADQPAYLRLFVAVIIALVVVNAVGMLLPLWWGRRVLHVDATVTFLPRYLLLVGVTALASRVLDVNPAILFGLLGSVALPLGSAVALRGRLAAIRASSLVGLAVVAWLILGALPGASGFVVALTAEVLNTVVLASLGSAVLVLLPIGRTSGRSILAWSPPVWAGLTITAFSILIGMLSPTFGALPGGPALAWVAAGAFAAFSIGAWAWQRFVSPALS